MNIPNTTTGKLVALKRIEQFMECSKLWAQYHIAVATTGMAKLRNVKRGDPKAEGGWRQLTDDEKVQDSLNTAKGHIHAMSEAYDNYLEVMQSLTDEEVKGLAWTTT